MTSDMMNFIYFMVVLFLFDTFFTMYSLNHVSLFPEMFIEEEERAEETGATQEIYEGLSGMEDRIRNIETILTDR